MNFVCSPPKLDISEVHMYKFSKWNVFSSGLYIKQFHLNTLDGNVDVAMRNNHNFTTKVLVTILRNQQQSGKTFTACYTEWYSVFHFVEDSI